MFVVSRREPAGDLLRIADSGREGQGAPIERDAQRLAFEKLEHRVRYVLMMADVVHRQDVRMRERGNSAVFAIEPCEGLGVSRQS